MSLSDHFINPRYRPLLSPTPGDTLFDSSRIVHIAIKLDETDWDTLRFQKRTVFDVLMPPSCMSAPFARPFTYFPCTVSVDGQAIRNVGVRKKGFLGSLSEIKPALKLRFNKYDCEQHLLGLRSITLNNAQQDPSFLRQPIAYLLFANANLAAPRCNFAHVSVNDRDLGLYVNVESINRQFLRRHYVDVGGNLYEGVLSDFRKCWINTFEAKTNRRTNSRADLWQTEAALSAPDSSVLIEAAARIDIDQFLSYWAMEVLLKHRDGYSAFCNNFYIYHDPISDRFQFLPWGIDGAMGRQPFDQQELESVFASGLLARRLYALPQSRPSYVNRLRQLLNSVWDEKSIISEIDRIEALITPIADPTGSAGLKEEIEGVRQFVLGRRQAITKELSNGAPAWNGSLLDPPCLKVIGELSATFSTEWATAAADPFMSGTGTMQAIIDGAPMQLGPIGVSSGPDGPYCILNIISQLPNGTYAILLVRVLSSNFNSGQTLASDWEIVFGELVQANPITNAVSLIGTFGIGNISFSSAGTQPGTLIAGSLLVQLVR
jgi:spore coat protein CotH